MRKLAWMLALCALLGCTSESSLPNPSGKGTIRAINAIKGSPDISFRIEERFIEALPYKFGSASQRYDDFEYFFNFEMNFFNESEPRRVARIRQKIDANRDYTFVATGNFTSPNILVWVTDEREFAESDTVFAMRFGHTSPSLGAVDVYFDAPGTAPVLGAAQGTLSFGEVLDPIDFPEGDYVITLTTAGDPSDIVYQSSTVTYLARATLIAPIFDGNENDTAPLHMRLINAQSGNTILSDVLTPPTVRFYHASISLPASDVYDDDLLTSQVLANHQFGDITGDIPVATGTTTYTYTAVGNTGAIQFESGIATVAGTHNSFIVIGEQGNRVATTFVPDRRRVANQVRVRLYHAALNHEELDFYFVDAGTSIDDVERTLGLTYSLGIPTLVFDEGSYDAYVTVSGEKTIVAGPVNVTTSLGDSIEFLLLDTVDPSTAELRVVPAP